MEPNNAEFILKFNSAQPRTHKYEANIFPSSEENEYFSMVEFSKQNFASFLTHVQRAIDEFPPEDKPYAIVFKPDSDEALFKVYGSTIYGYIIEDLT